MMSEHSTIINSSDYDDEFDHGIVVLSYEGIRVVYKDLAKEFSKFAIALDLTENELTDLSFLKSFNKLESLVLDKNRQMCPTTMPTMKNLRFLWLNSCNIPDLGKWIEVIRLRCPKLTHLSMMNNPGSRLINGASSSSSVGDQLSGGGRGVDVEEEQFRSYVASRLKNLQFLDHAQIVRKESKKSAGSELISKLFRISSGRREEPNLSMTLCDQESNTSSSRGNISEDSLEQFVKKSTWWPMF